ncbi:hypothetical protein KSS87_008329, partial [Heliosperma pusillum]
WGYRILSWDLVGSGKTRRENNLKEVEGGVVLQSQNISNSTTSISDMNLAREVQANRCLEKM